MGIIGKGTNTPLISFIIPTYNAQAYLKRCIESIQSLKYPAKKLEIICADGGSTDNTLNILKDYDVKVVKNKKRIAEYGKYKAFIKSKGKYVVFLDADNIIVSKDWLKHMLLPLQENNKIVGTESNYLIADDFSSLNTYVNLLVIVDPYARILSSRPQSVEINDRYIVKKFAKGTAPVSGANGFIWRRSVLEPFAASSDTLEETTILQRITASQDTLIANVPNVGIYHYYSRGLKDYLKKRKKIANKFLERRTHKQTWVDTRCLGYKFICALYLASIIGPTGEMIFKLRSSKRAEWLWHPIVCFLTISTYGYYLVKSKVVRTAP